LYFGYSELNPSALKFRITSRTRSWLVNATFANCGHVHPLGGQKHHVRAPTGHHRPGAPADDPHQPPSLAIIDLADPQPFGHRPGLGDQHLHGKRPAGSGLGITRS
jgi:hypothetical protein